MCALLLGASCKDANHSGLVPEVISKGVNSQHYNGVVRPRLVSLISMARELT